MTTDITELARERLKEKFDAWFEREYKHLESSKYTDAVPHIKYGFWTAYQAGGAELVEALESEKRICATWRKTAKSTGEKLEKAQQRIIELVARKEKRLPVPYAYLRESGGQIQISIGAERPSDRSGGYATPWFPIYTAAGIKVEAE